MSNLEFIQIQVLERERLLRDAGDSRLVRSQLTERLNAARGALENALKDPGNLFPTEVLSLARVAIFLRGDSIENGGIRPAFAAAVLTQYERMFVAQALHDEREAALRAGRQRRRRGSKQPELRFVGTPTGSFGLEFTPLPCEDKATNESRSAAIGRLVDAIAAVGESDDESLEGALKPIPAGVIQQLPAFFTTLASYHAQLRVSSTVGASVVLDTGQIERTALRLDRNIVESEETLPGMFRGATLDSGQFDFAADDGQLISGVVDEAYSEEELTGLLEYVNVRCIARFRKTAIKSPTGLSAPTYVLTSIAPIDTQKVLPPSGPSAIE